MTSRSRFLLLALVLAAAAVARADDTDPPEVTVGERLFLETRFAQFYFAHAQANANSVLPAGDPVMNTTVTTGQPFAGPFAGQSMNCRACHLVDEQNATGGNRTYDDFAQRSPIPQRVEDRMTLTPRNSPPLVTAARVANGHVLFHHDGEFSTSPDLIRATFTGRNFGWLPQEQVVAVHHIANIIRNDDGTGDLAQDYNALPYRVLLKGTSPTIPAELRIPGKYRLDVMHATDSQVLDAVTNLVDAYDKSLQFAKDEKGKFNGSPYDAFLAKNGLPIMPKAIRVGLVETDLAYSRRLRTLVDGLTSPKFVTGADGSFATHDQTFQFGATELAGLKIFLAEPAKNTTPTSLVGNCIACHAAPSFSDFSFHNTGSAQEEYDAIHGSGTFAALVIPKLATRQLAYNAYLPATTQHPSALGVFKDIPTLNNPGHTDLGMWNTIANPDMPHPQSRLRQLLLIPLGNNSLSAMVDRAVARFKTPSLRDLGHGEPYLHTGRKDTIEDVLQFYRSESNLTRAGQVRNPDSKMGDIHLGPADVAPLAAFLRSLNEDYQ